MSELPESMVERFAVEVTNPYASDDRQEERFECKSISALASRWDDLTGVGRALSSEVAARVANAGRFEFEDEETGRTVTAERVGAAVPA